MRKGVAKTPYPLPLRPPVMGLVLFLAGQLVGGLAESFNGFQFLPHGFHVDAVHLFLCGQQVNLTPPFLRGDFRDKKIHLFTCKNCGYKSNDDRIAAMNLYRMGINYLYDSQVPDTVAAE